jgi:NAD(P)-dependent dehydrogenase (short-subunit alcohol dehydrogenase family)
MGKLDGLVAVVTGCSQGIGLAMAKAFLAEGASLVISARRGDVVEPG